MPHPPIAPCGARLPALAAAPKGVVAKSRPHLSAWSFCRTTGARRLRFRPGRLRHPGRRKLRPTESRESRAASGSDGRGLRPPLQNRRVGAYFRLGENFFVAPPKHKAVPAWAGCILVGYGETSAYVDFTLPHASFRVRFAVLNIENGVAPKKIDVWIPRCGSN